MNFYKKKVQELMYEKKYTMNKLSRLMGASHTSVSLWLSGCHLPRERNIILMARALKVSVSEISDMEEADDISAEISGYFQGWGASLKKNKTELEAPCARAIEEIENIKSEQYRLRTVTRAFMLTMQSMLYVKNYYGKYILANESYLKAIGLAVNINIIGKTDDDIMSEKCARINNSQDMEIINIGKVEINKSVKFPFPNSKIKWCVMTKVPLKDDKQNIVGMVASFTNITEEEKLRRQEKILSEAIIQSNAAIGVVSVSASAKRKFIYLNDALLDMIGYSRNDLQKDFFCWRKCIEKDDRQNFDEHVANHNQDVRSLLFGYDNPKTGKLIYIRIKSLRVKDSNLIYNCFYDETEKIKEKKDKEKLISGYSLLGSFIDKSRFALFVGEYRDTILNVEEYIYRNKISYKYIGENEKWKDIIVPEQRNELLKLAKNKKFPRKAIYNIIRKDGTVGTVEERTRIREDNGRYFFSSLIIDIEKRDKVEVAYQDASFEEL